jgi:hypothetical protein
MLAFIIPLLLGSIIGFLVRGKPSESFVILGKKRAAWAIGIGFLGLVVGLPIGLATSQTTGPQIAALIGAGLGLGVFNVLSLENPTYQKWSDRHSFVWLIVAFTCAIVFSAYQHLEIKVSMASQKLTESEMSSLDLSELQRKAENGDVAAQLELGSRYMNEKRGGVESDAEAVKWYRLAAEQGNAEAQVNLGRLYFLGAGVPTNYAEAAKWYRLAAEQGNAAGQWCIGIMFANGFGVTRDDIQAVNWFQRAADQGNEFAQYDLGYMYFNGRGVPKNYVEAYLWISLAAAKGVPVADEYLPVVESKMTPGQIAEAQQRSAAWKPRSN